MSRKTTRIKKDATAVAVPQSYAEANEFVAEILHWRAGLARIEADMNGWLKSIKADHEERARPLKDQIAARLAGLQTWCSAHRAELTRDGRRKFHRFEVGSVSWRQRPPRVVIRGVKAVVEYLREKRLRRFLRVSYAPDKEAMLKAPERAAEIPGVTFASGEEFIVEPFEAELSEQPAREVSR